MRKVLFDTNIILDVILERQPFFLDSQKVIALVGEDITGYLNPISLVNIYYIVRKIKGIESTKEFIYALMDTFEITDLNKEICENSLKSERIDFEDAVQEFSAIYSDCEIIVTRNVADFKNSNLQILEPAKFIEWLDKNEIN